MLTVDVKFIAYELAPGLQGGVCDAEDGSTVKDLLALCECRSGVSIPDKNFRFIYPLLNGRPLTLDSAITESGTLHICRVVTGG